MVELECTLKDLYLGSTFQASFIILLLHEETEIEAAHFKFPSL